jgi:hypothetical protein
MCNAAESAVVNMVLDRVDDRYLIQVRRHRRWSAPIGQVAYLRIAPGSVSKELASLSGRPALPTYTTSHFLGHSTARPHAMRVGNLTTVPCTPTMDLLA